MTSDRLRYTGVAAVAVLWATLGAGSVAAGFDLLGTRPLSHLTGSASSSLLFGAGLAAAAVLFLAFSEHVRGRFPTSVGFSVAMAGGMAAQLVAAFVPIEGAGEAGRVHTVSALVLGASLPVFMWRFAVTQRPGRLRRTAARLAGAEAAACALGVWLSRGGVAPLAEIVPAAVFHLWVGVLTFWPDQGPGARRPELAGASDGAGRGWGPRLGVEAGVGAPAG